MILCSIVLGEYGIPRLRMGLCRLDDRKYRYGKKSCDKGRGREFARHR